MSWPQWRRTPLPTGQPGPLTFTARLPSSLAGIAFAAHFEVEWTHPSLAADATTSARKEAWARRAVREKASRIAARQHPRDPEAAADAVLTDLPRPVIVDGDVRVEVTVRQAVFTLDDTARAGLADYDMCQLYAQQRRDSLDIQARALRDVLAHPGLARAWLIRHAPELLDKVTIKGSEGVLEAINNAGPPPEPVLWQDPLIDVLRDLVSPLRNAEDRAVILTKVEQILDHLGRADLVGQLSENGTEKPPRPA